MLDTPQDMFYTIATIVIVVVSAFACVALFYTTTVLKRIAFFLDQGERGIEHLTCAIHTITDKVSDISTYMSAATNVARIASEAYSNRTTTRKNERKRS